jgi:hypothetical protein
MNKIIYIITILVLLVLLGVVFYLKNNKCEKEKEDSSTSSKKSVKNCSNYDSTNSICNSCDTGYQLLGTKCEKLPENCEQIDSSSGNCGMCNNGYHLANDICQINPSNCEIYNNENNGCIKCFDNYYLYNGMCKKQSDLGKECVWGINDSCKNDYYCDKKSAKCAKSLEDICANGYTAALSPEQYGMCGLASSSNISVDDCFTTCKNSVLCGGATWKKNATGNNGICTYKAGNFRTSDCKQIDWNNIKISAKCNTKGDNDIQSYIKPEFLNQSASVTIN